MSRCTIVDEPSIEGDAVVIRVIHQDPAVENTGRVFVCRFSDFDTMTVEMFPEGQAPISMGEYRAEAANAARAFADANIDKLERLFEELSRRRSSTPV